MWLFSGILFVFGDSFFSTNDDIVGKSVDIIWLVFSTITYFLGYYAIHQPEVFKVPQPVSLFDENSTAVIEVISDKIRTKSTPSVETDAKEAEARDKALEEQLLQQKEKVEQYLKTSRAYANPNLSLNELAAKLKMPTHVLSKIINDGFGVNFFDFVNGYRIDEFKVLVCDPRFRNQTFLAIAFEVGFNSKTAFNRSFKKMTNQTPSDYFAGVGLRGED